MSRERESEKTNGSKKWSDSFYEKNTFYKSKNLSNILHVILWE